MDTIETNAAPAGGEGATSSEDTAVQVDTQPVETDTNVSDVKTEEAGEASETLYAGKYKSVEELEKAYQQSIQLVGKASQKAELVNELERETGMSADQIKNALAAQKQAQVQKQMAKDPAGYALAEIEQLKGQLALQQEEKELDKFLTSEEGKWAEPYRDKIFKLGLNVEKDKSYADIAKEYFGEARAQGQQDAYKRIEQKQTTQATGTSQASPKSKLTPEEMDRMSAAELEAILPWADTSNRPY